MKTSWLGTAALAAVAVLAAAAPPSARADSPMTVSVPIADVVGKVAPGYYTPPKGKKVVAFALKDPGVATIIKVEQFGDGVRIDAFAPPGSIIGASWYTWVQLDVVLENK